MFYFIAPWLLFVLGFASNAPDCFSCSNPPPGTIFCDDFESEEDPGKRYFGYDDDEGDFIRMKGYMINAVFFENYWNKGAPKDQERYFDNILIATRPISCKCEDPG